MSIPNIENGILPSGTGYYKDVSSIENYDSLSDLYSYRVGSEGESIIRWVLEIIFIETDLDYSLNILKDVRENGPDIIVWDDSEEIICKFEILNLRKSSYITKKRAYSIKKNLRGAKFKGLFTSFSDNLSQQVNRILRNVPICYTNIQILPDDIKRKLSPLESNRVSICDPEEEAFLELKKRILTFLLRIEMISLVYNDYTGIGTASDNVLNSSLESNLNHPTILDIVSHRSIGHRSRTKCDNNDKW